MIAVVPTSALAAAAVVIRDDGCMMVNQYGVVNVVADQNHRVGTFSRNCNSTVQCKATGVTNTTGKAIHHDFGTTGGPCFTGFGYTTNWHQIISKSGVAHLVCHINECADPVCGDGLPNAPETCDDGNTVSDDGCSSTCEAESGYDCDGAPSVCETTCGDGVAAGAEDCDDGNTANGDGCTDACLVESGYGCTGTPSVCDGICGDSQIIGTEECDDGNTDNDDGCSAACTEESGYDCTGGPSVCQTICGDGFIRGSEECDDGNDFSDDGCSSNCTEEPDYYCSGEPSICLSDED